MSSDCQITIWRPLQMDDGAARENIKDPRELLKATAALSAKGGPKGQPGVPGLALGHDDDLDEYDELGAAGPGLRRTPTMLARMKKQAISANSFVHLGEFFCSSRRIISIISANSFVHQALGGLTPRSGRASFGKGGGKGLFLSKSAKGSIVAAAMLRTSKRADSGWQVISASSLIHLGEFSH